MTVWEKITALAVLGQLIILIGGVLVAYWQLGSLRRQQEADLIQRIFDKFSEAHFARALDFVYNELPQRLKDRTYISEIGEGRATAESHPELTVMHFFNGLGLLVHSKMVGEYPVVPFVASPCLRSWHQLAPVVELMRRHYPHAYTPFESLVVRSRAIDLTRINTRFRSQTPKLKAQWETTERDLVEQRISLLDKAPE